MTSSVAPELIGRVLWGLKKHNVVGFPAGFQVEVQWMGYERPVFVFADTLKPYEE